MAKAEEGEEKSGRPLSWWTPLYLVDYLTIVVVIVLAVVVALAMEPSDAFADELHRLPKETQKTYYNYKIQAETLPLPAFIPIVLLVPLAVMLVSQVWVTSLHDLHNGVMGLIFAFALNAVVTDLLKKFFGQLRPDYLDRVREDDGEDAGRQSLPSGHASTASCMAVFLALYLHGKLRPYRAKDGDGFVLYFLMSFAWLLFALYAGATRVTDFRHHLLDVFIGWLLGLLMAVAVYCLVYYPPLHPLDGSPKLRRGSIRQFCWRTTRAGDAVEEDEEE